MSNRDVQLNIGTVNGGIALGHGAQATGVGGTIHNQVPNDLMALIAAIRQEIPSLPPEQKEGAAVLVSQVEKEANLPKPDVSKIRGLLTSVKTICEGVVGSMIAAYLSGRIGS